MSKKYYFNVPLFTGDVVIHIGKKLPKSLRKRDFGGYARWRKKKNQFVIALPETPNWPLTGHECVHAANFIFRAHGQKLDLKNDEAQAYMVHHLLEMVRVSYKAYKKKK